MKNLRSILSLMLSLVLLLSACGFPAEPEPETEDEPVDLDIPLEELLPESEDSALSPIEEAVLYLEETTITFSDTASFTTPGPEDIALDEETGSIYVTNTLLVFAQTGTDRSEMDALAAECGAAIVGYVEVLDLYQLQFSSAMDMVALNAVVASLESSPFVAMVTPDYVSDVCDDFSYTDLWYDENNPDVDANLWGIKAIHAEEAWEYAEKYAEEGVVIGVMEGTVSKNHPDLTVSSVINLNQDAAWGERTTTTSTLWGHMGQDHGTHVAGTIAAIPNNQTGITGVCAVPGTSVCACNTNGYLSVGTFMTGISTMITDYGIQVINISQNRGSYDRMYAASRGNTRAIQSIEDEAATAEAVLNKLLDKGYEFVICMSAGNRNSDTYYKTTNQKATYGYTTNKNLKGTDKTPLQGVDAKYNHFLNCIDDPDIQDRIIVVGNAGQNDDGTYYAANHSNVGSRVDVMAPGTDIYSLTYEGNYKTMSGTSMATPHVSGVAALLFAINPDATGARIKHNICSYADFSTTFSGVSAGMLQADSAALFTLSDLGYLLETVAPTAEHLMGLTYGQISNYTWDTSYGASSGQSSVGFSEEFIWGEATYAFSFDLVDPREDSTPNYLHVRNNQGSSLAIPITYDIWTGQTYGELVASGAAVTGLDENNHAKLYLVDWTVTLIFEGSGDDAVLIAAKFNPAMDEPQPGDTASLHALPSLTEMMQMSQETVRTVEWNSIQETESGIDDPTRWTTLMCEWNESSYSFTWYDGYTYPSTCYVTDFLSGGLALPITDSISTGMTFAEIQAVESVSDLEFYPLGYSCFFYPEQGCCITLFFDGGTSDAVLHSAEIVYFE